MRTCIPNFFAEKYELLFEHCSTVLSALVFVASVNIARGEKKPPISGKKYRWEVKIPYLEDSKIQASPSFPIAKETLRLVKSTASSAVPETQVMPSVTKTFNWNVDIQYGSASEPSTQANYQLNHFKNFAGI